MTKFLKLLLVLLFFLQVLVAGGFELAHDEAYYWLFSRHLGWGYFDHPPLVAVIIRTFSFLPHTEFSVRIGFILLQFATLFSLFKIIEPRHQLTATLLFFAFPLASLVGLFALPDVPLLFFTGLYCVMLKRFLEKNDVTSSVMLGAVTALLLYAKYHGILVVFFTLVALPRLFKEKNFYLVTLISLILFFPHILWQFNHDFATLRYHFLERPSSGFSLKRMLEYVGVQIGLAGFFVGPLVWWIFIKTPKRSEFDRVMKLMTFGTIIFFFISTASKKFEANWTVFLAFPLIYFVVGSAYWEKTVVKRLLYVSFAIVVTSRLVLLSSPDVSGLKRLKEFNGWDDWSHEVRSKCEGTLVANTYQVASKLAFYLNEEIHSLNYHSRKNQFDFWRFDLKNPMKNVCYITNASELEGTPLVTPEGRGLKLVTNYPYEELLQRKAKSVRE